MSGLLNLPGELLCLILKHVKPSDIDNFLLSFKRLHRIASKSFLDSHALSKYRLRTIDNWVGMSTRYTTPELLELILDEPCKADYVKAMVVRPWRVQWDKGSLPRYWTPGMLRSWYPYSSDRMRAFEEEIGKNTSIPSRAKARWIRNMRAGDETPVIALLLLRLHHLTSLVVALGDLEDRFMILALRHIAKNPHSSSLSRLRHAEIRRTSRDIFPLRSDVQYLLAFAALPSVVSLEGYELFDPFSRDNLINLVPQSTSLQHLKLESCLFRRDTLGKLIKSARSLRSFTYIHVIRHRRYIDPPHEWICEVLLESASTTLEALVLDYSPRLDFSFCLGSQLRFSNFTHLQTLTIDYWSLTGPKFPATDEIPTLLPASLETLVITHFFIESYEWLRQFMEQIAKAKTSLLPRLTHLKLEEAYPKASLLLDFSVLRAVFAIGAEAKVWTIAEFDITRL